MAKAQLFHIMKGLPAGESTIIAGDYNLPQRDAALRIMHPDHIDCFSVSGKGWGNTIVNDLPILRIDQIWVSTNLHSTQTFSIKTTYSDHRMVIADINATR